MKNLLTRLFALVIPMFVCSISAYGYDINALVQQDDGDNVTQSGSGTYSMQDLLVRETNSTACSTAEFKKALENNADMVNLKDEDGKDVSEDVDSSDIDTWVHFSFAQREVLEAVLACPEFKDSNIDPDETIVFEPITYTFPNGREIRINYETQKKVLEQRLLLTTKRELTPADISPDIISDAQKGNIWTNVDPAWYAILVTEHGALDEYVGPDKNNLVSLEYIRDNIDKLYPKDHSGPFRADCTSKTAWAGDTDMINRAVHKSAGDDEDAPEPQTDEEKELIKKVHNNDFYVMGDGNLQWLSIAEIAVDVVLTVVSWGGYAIAKTALNVLRATRTFAKARKALKTLRTSFDVAKYIQKTQHLAHIQRAIKTADKIEDSFSAISKFSRQATQRVKTLTSKIDYLKANKGTAKEIGALEKELELAQKEASGAKTALETATKMRELEKTADKVSDTQKTIQNLEKSIKDAETNLKNLEKNSQLYQKEQSNIARLKNNLNGAKSNLKKTEKAAENAKSELAQLKNNYSKQLNELEKTNLDDISKLEKTNDVIEYKKVAQAERDAARTAYLFRQSKIALKAKRGLLPVRVFRAAKALRSGFKAGQKIKKTTKVVRRASTSSLSNKINDWLFHNTMRNIGALSKVPAQLSTLNTVVKIAGGMYDYTDTETGEFTNNIDLKPWLLLGGDDLEGYENVVNQGMWLFWTGSSTSGADDDAAFLQAMHFAETFHQDLVEIQDDYNIMACDVDIYVVRPVIRNPGTDDEKLYYLFMNDTPWTTNGYNIPNDGTNPMGVPTMTSEEKQQAIQDAENEAKKQDGQTQDEQTQESVSVDSNDTTEYGEEQVSSSSESALQTSYYTPSVQGGVTRTAAGIRYTEPAYDGTRMNQPCTKPAHSKHYGDEIFTSGRYKNDPAFEKAMITNFRAEGRVSNHPKDKGGYTKYGVSSKFFPQVKNPNFSRADAEDIAYNSFYKKLRINKLPDAIRGDVFMALWGTGSRQASIGLLQRIMGLESTGTIDQKTINAAINYKGNLRTEFLDAREKAFKRSDPTFRKGWLNAIELYRTNGCHTVVNQTDLI